MARPTYFTSALASTAGANKHHLILYNAAGSGATIQVSRITACGAPTAAVTGLIIALAARRITAAPTLGTGLTFGKAVTASAALPAQITANTGGTLATGVAAEAFGIGEVSGEEAIGPFSAVVYEAPIDGSEPITLVPGEGITVQQGALASAGAIHVVCRFTTL